MRYRIVVNKNEFGYHWSVHEIRGDFEARLGESFWATAFKWMAILRAKLWIKRYERRRNYPIEVANVEYETKNQAT